MPQESQFHTVLEAFFSSINSAALLKGKYVPFRLFFVSSAARAGACFVRGLRGLENGLIA